MAAYSNTVPAARPGRQAAYGTPVQMPMPVQMQAQSAPAGTFSPGTKIQVGQHRVMILKYLSEGGFAHVYLVKLSRPIDGTDQAVLKRVAVPDRETLRGMRIEVETMKRLKGHRPIVTYIDSHVSELKGGGYEVFLLMEYCDGGGLIDFMNTRLQHRLTEPEILNIFSDIAEGVACMHYLKPPLLHRDLKVENVLITMYGSKRKFKVCDFGSATPPKPAPQSIVECRLMDEDVQKHTTMQYRSPEMVDVYRKQPMDEKSDIWALGVLLYKLCYYTTPFEEQGQLAILNASYRFPSHPVFSDRLKKLIASMLRENQRSRPNIFQVLQESCLMQGREVPIRDIYSSRSQSEPRSEKQLPPEPKGKSTPAVGAVYSPPPQQQTTAIPDIAPMRRGRPTTNSSQPAPTQAQRPQPSPSPMRVTNGDPFAALDSKTGANANADELSSRFPTLDQFALLHDQGAQFDFDSPKLSPVTNDNQTRQNLQAASQLADDGFAKSQPQPLRAPISQRKPVDTSRVAPGGSSTDVLGTSPAPGPAHKPASAPPKPQSEMSRASAIIFQNPELQALSPPLESRQETVRKPVMVSAGTMTNDTPPERQSHDYPPVHRFPPSDQHRPTSLPRHQDITAAGQRQPESKPSQPSRPLPSPKLSDPPSQSTHKRHASSSRPSLEGGRPSLEYLEPLARSTSTSRRPRPASTYLESSVDYLREREAAPRPVRSGHLTPSLSGKVSSPRIEPQDEPVIESNVEFLRSMEDSEGKKKDRTKRSSLTSLSGTKNMLAGRFGDAFKKFEGGTSGSAVRSPSGLKDMQLHELTPIAGSEATDSRSDDGRLLGEPEMSPEMRRDLEARALAEEERRVEAAAAEYKQRMAARDAGGGSSAAPLPKSIGGVSRAVSIQNRVQNLLDESQRSSQQVQRTASGYGKFSDDAVAKSGSSRPTDKALPEIPQKPTSGGGPAAGRAPPPSSSSSQQPPASSSSSASTPLPRVRPNNLSSNSGGGKPIPPAKPSPAPKPMHLNSIPTGGRPRSPPKRPQQQQQQLPARPAGAQQSSSEQQLVGVGMPGRPSLDMTFQEKEDYIKDFSKRFPSLSSIEMVERDIEAEGNRPGGQ
ncbi:kinase-like domain-containing protein [Xylariaceae sp. FL0804]|nr:kinase-like domain-containing protein [Xylariaceae sp. FL0804]